ncbi:MAG: galactosyldiacylglycerol synthase [Chloroflexi bacterium]|nr:galactosyldiacylglycerol synthase [Chloroflexota bacterium]MBP8055897.1 galactosyldiacylglycerol synthase [Chloroflexota bacterium]
MITLYDNESGEKFGTISETDLTFLHDHLEEEWLEDQDYYINVDTLDMFSEQGVPETLLNLLREGLRGRDEMEIRWSRQ